MNWVNVYNKDTKRLYSGELLNEVKVGITPMVMPKGNEMYYTFPRAKAVHYLAEASAYHVLCENGQTLIITRY